MEEKKIFQKKEPKFVDNVAYKSKFQFLIWVNDYVICQRYFKINGFNEESINTAEFIECMDGIVRSIQNDLESKSRIFMWYTNLDEPLQLTGFFTEEEAEKYGSDFVQAMLNPDIKDVVTEDKTFHKDYMVYDEGTCYDYNELTRPENGEFMFKFVFLIDDVPVYERIWDGNVYPKFVRNGVDLSNNYSSYDNRETSAMSFGAIMVRYMQSGKVNLISDFIRRICDTLSNSYSEEYEYTIDIPVYRNNNVIDKERYDRAVAYYGGELKVDVLGHTDIKPVDKKYNYKLPFDNLKHSWKVATKKKTAEYFWSMYPSQGQLEYIDRKY